MTRPVLGVICCTRAVGQDVGQVVMTRYLEAALRFADCAAVLIPSMPTLISAQEVVPRIDGLLLTGSPSNVEPWRYGHDAAADGADWNAMFTHGHDVDLVEGGLLRGALKRDRLRVNSVHYQGIGELAPELSPEAVAPDGMIEGFSASMNGARVLAVQWHPEWEVESASENQQFFRLLGRALRGDLSEAA